MIVKRTAEVIDRAKVDAAIDMVLELFASEELTIAECVKVSEAIRHTFKANYPKVYSIIALEKAVDNDKLDALVAKIGKNGEEPA